MSDQMPRWSDADDATLRAGLAAGLTYGEIGAQLGRTDNACSHRRKILGLKSRANSATHGRQKEPPPSVEVAALLPVVTDGETMRDWLYEEWLRRGMTHAEAADRSAHLTARGLAFECRPMRIAEGLPPFVCAA